MARPATTTAAWRSFHATRAPTSTVTTKAAKRVLPAG